LAKKQKRDNAYYRRRLEADPKHADILLRLDNGEIPNMAVARREAGIISKPKSINALRRAWKNASWPQRMRFFSEIFPSVKEEIPRFKEAFVQAKANKMS